MRQQGPSAGRRKRLQPEPENGQRLAG